MNESLWIIAISVLVGISCSLVGVLLVLRRLSMLGDAISHSVLFGIVSAYLVTQSRAPLPMLIGAASIGLLTAGLTHLLSHRGKLQEDASMGVVFTWLFALGVILISGFAGQVDLDQDCVLHGEIAFAPFDVVSLIGQVEVPRAFAMLAGVALVNVAVIGFGFRRFKLICFDPLLASSLGINVQLWHYLLMALVSLTVVASFESVGAILVVALLVVPANTAYLHARSLGQMIAGALVCAIISATGGYYLAAYQDGSIAAGVAIVSGLLLSLSVGAEIVIKSRSAKSGAVGSAEGTAVTDLGAS